MTRQAPHWWPVHAGAQKEPSRPDIWQIINTILYDEHIICMHQYLPRDYIIVLVCLALQTPMYASRQPGQQLVYNRDKKKKNESLAGRSIELSWAVHAVNYS